MSIHELRRQVYEANMLLPKHGLALFTWGNVSGFDRAAGVLAIKPGGVPYEELTPENMVLVDLAGNVVEGSLKPSSDTPTHIALYRAFPEIGGIAHTHSTYATAFAQAGRFIPHLGTTHADYFRGRIPVTRKLTAKEIAGDYEAETGRVIIEALRGNNPLDMPAALVRSHGPFTWGADAAEAARNAVVLEETAKMACLTYNINSSYLSGYYTSINKRLLDKHFLRKHGKDAYYGQNKR